MEPKLKNRGLLPKTPDPRDISKHKVLGSLPVAALATTDFLVVPPLEIMNQDINYPSDFCTAYAAAATSEAEDGETEVPEYTFAKAKQFIINKSFGANATPEQIASVIGAFGLQIRDIMNAGVAYGFLERQYDPFGCNTPTRPDRETVADYRNWPADLDAFAFEHAKNSYMAVDGPYDMFDNIRAALFANDTKRIEIVTGANYRESWSSAPGGVIYQGYYQLTEPGSGHSFAIIGQATTEKGLCLVAQMSDGIELNGQPYGDQGLFFFDRATVNLEFAAYGAFMWSNIPKAVAQVHNDFNFTFNSSAWQKFWQIASYIIKNAPAVIGSIFK